MSDDLGPGPRKEAQAPAQTAPLLAVDGLCVGGCALHEVLGRGGMGTVYRATQLALGREVAIKVLPASGVPGDLVARFAREARTASALEHPHSIPIYAAGEEDGLLYLVMRLVKGPDLSALIAVEGPLAPARAVGLIAQIAGALDAAHAAGLVHRDVKPANILVEPRPGGDHGYLSDFGLTRQMVGATAITRVGEWVGSVDYVSPEQIEGRPIDGRADVYALAGVLYTALTGRPPFVRCNPAATARAHREDPPPSLGGEAEAMSAVIARGMAKAPDDRFASAGDLVLEAMAALPATGSRPLVRDPAPCPAPALTAPLGTSSRQVAPGRPEVVQTRPARAGPRSRPIWAVLGALAVVAVGAAIGVIVGSSRGPAPPSFTAGKAAAPSSFPHAARFAGNGFSFAYPAGWYVVENQRPLRVFIRTKVVSPDGQEVLIVDRVPGDAMSPKARAISVSQSTERTPGYEPGSLAPASLDGRSAFTWSFRQTKEPLPARLDVFERLGTSGYAVLAEGPTLTQVSPLALTVAHSLEGS